MFISKKLHKKMIKAKENEIEELKKYAEGKMKLAIENIEAKEVNKKLRDKNENQKNFINNIIKELYSNVKTDEQKISKLKELVSDWQSKN